MTSEPKKVTSIESTGSQGTQAAQEWQPKIAAFICNWCTYAGADLAGTSRMNYKPNMRIIRVPCTGRVDPLFLIKAFENGADAVLVSGCHPGDCHYVAGNYHARRRWTFLRSLMQFVGVDEKRLHFSWVSASEGGKWAKLVDEVTETVRSLGPFDAYRRLTESRGIWDPASPWNEAWGPEIPDGVPLPEAGPIDHSLRRLAKEILETKEAGVVIGHAWAGRRRRTVPVFITDPAETDKLIANPLCVNNLANYLTRHAKDVKALGRPAVVAKACDVKTLVVLLQEAQIKREDVVIIGVPCGGVVYRQELWTGQLTAETLAPKCVGCRDRVPQFADKIVEGEIAAPPAEGLSPIDQKIAEIDRLPAQERWAFWMDHFDRCIKCYACRQVCPLCYCERCITDKNQPQWIDTSAHAEGNLAWNLIRAIHLAGRCTFCGECDRACPANIPLNLVNRKLQQAAKEAFGYESGIHPDDHPPMIVFKPDDREEFIK